MKNTDDRIHDIAWYATRIEHLSGFMLPARRAVMERVLAQRTCYMTVCTENMFHPQNASALVRTCEAFGIQEIHTVEELCGFQPNLHIVRGTDKWIDIHRHGSTAEAVAALRSSGYRIVATTPHRDETLPETFDISAGPFALVFGTEHAGISDQIIDSADAFIRIPMYGFVESLNVSASASILIRHLSERIRQSNLPWFLTPAQRMQILYRWMKESVRDSERILMQFKASERILREKP